MATSNRIQSNMNTVAFSCFATPATAIQLLRDEILANNKNAKLSPESFSAEEKALVNEIMHASATVRVWNECREGGSKYWGSCLGRIVFLAKKKLNTN